ncbi:MAG: hypothetical protein U9O53_05245 [archaeon]|nr:hypothetical protein [archaeon]
MEQYIFAFLKSLNEFESTDIHQVNGSFFDIVKLAEEAKDELSRLLFEGFLNEDMQYPIPTYKSSIERFISFSKIQRNIERDPDEIIDDATIRRKLTIVPTEICLNNCVHCLSDSKDHGDTLPLTALDNLGPEFYRMFDQVHFGLEGDALETRSTYIGEDAALLDYIKSLHEKGIDTFNLDVKSFRSQYAKDTFHSIKEYVKENEIDFNVRISFNLYGPNVYDEADETKAMNILKEELFGVLRPSLEFADSITLNVLGSFKYSKSHILKTNRFLQTILFDNNFGIPKGREWREIDFENPEAAIHDLYKEIGLNKVDYNPIHDFFPFYGYDEGNGNYKTIFVKYGRTLNMGRWKPYNDNGSVQNPVSSFVDKDEQELPLCDALSTQGMTILPNGDISICNGTYAKRVPFSNIYEGQDTIFAKLKGAISVMQDSYKNNLEKLMNQEKILNVCNLSILSPIYKI